VQFALIVPTVRDRVVQMATLLILEPIFEEDFEDCSYGFRPGRSAHQALEEIRGHIKAGYQAVYDADLRGYLDTYTQCSYGYSNRSGAGSTTLIRKPLRCPWRIWRASSSPRFTRCQMVWRETPSRLLASTTDT
jgi:hypothetical protein